MMEDDYLEEKKLGAIYSFKLLKRLLNYVKRYKFLFLLATIITLFTAILDISLPYITKMAIDQCLVPSYAELEFSGKNALFENSIKRRYKEYLHPLKGDFYFIDLSRVRKEDKVDLEAKGYLSKERFLGIDLSKLTDEKKEKVLAIIRKYPSIFTQKSGQLFFISSEDIRKIESSDLRLLREKDLSRLKFLCLIFFSILILSFFFNFAQIYLLQYSGQRIMYDMRVQIFSHLLLLPISFFDKNPIGRLVTRATNDVEAVNEMYTTVLVAGLKDVFLLAGILVVMFRMNPELTLLFLLFSPPMAYISFVFRVKARKAFREVRRKLAKLNAFTAESISGMRIIQLFTQEKKNLENFKRINHEKYMASMHQLLVFAIFRPLIEIIGASALALIIWQGGSRVITEALTLGGLTAFLSYAEMFFRPIRDIAEKFNILQSAMASSERIFQLLDQKREDRGKGKKIANLKGKIEFQNVWFSYKDEEWVLKDVSFTVMPGEKVALVGHTGGGKTSIISLLLRFYEFQKGKILLDGVDIRDLDLSFLRSQIGLVLQDTFLFSGDIKSNIRLRNSSISDEKLWEAARHTNAHIFIERLPGKYEAEVRERGAEFSQGQRQLLAFTRALAFDPKILILDEATANIDSETELLIQQSLKRLLLGRTSLIIAHRLSTVRDADKILVVHKGRIVEMGTHQELLRKKGYYHYLYKLQFKPFATSKMNR